MLTYRYETREKDEGAKGQGWIRKEKSVRRDLTHPLICESKAIVSDDDGTGGEVASCIIVSCDDAVLAFILAR